MTSRRESREKNRSHFIYTGLIQNRFIPFPFIPTKWKKIIGFRQNEMIECLTYRGHKNHG